LRLKINGIIIIVFLYFLNEFQTFLKSLLKIKKIMEREIEKLSKGIKQVSLNKIKKPERPTKVRRPNPKVPGNKPLYPRKPPFPDMSRLSLFGKRTKTKAVGLTPDQYTIQTSTIPNAGNGAFANIPLLKGTTLGYYKGKRLSKQQYDRLKDQSYVWELSSRSGPIYVDGKDPKRSNWLRFLNDSRDRRVNVEPYQYKGNIYYRTIKNIAPGQELFISYGDSYWD
jgi:hypothetical protein